jgi:ligand-binding SRPBCC domain-containing protein
MAFYQYKAELKIPRDINEVWDFISSPVNLKEITPVRMNFTIITELPDLKMYPGMIIGYRVSPLPGFRTTWITEITHVLDRKYFIDEQRIGPYAMWHHEHWIESIQGGVLMTDIVSYQPPMGFLGAVANKLFIRRQIDEIFQYRRMILEKKFGVYPSLNS